MTAMTTGNHRDTFLREAMTLAVPIMLQNLVQSSMGFIDTLLLGGLGQEAIAASGFVNQYFFVLTLLLFGLTSGSGIFVAQYSGKGDHAGMRRMLVLCLAGAAIGAIPFVAVAMSVPGGIMHVFSRDSAVISLGVTLFRWMAPAQLAMAISFSYSGVLRSSGDSRTPMMINACAVGFNTLLAWMLIYGVGIFPAMGVAGAGIAMLAARVLEAGAMIIVVNRKGQPLRLERRDLQGISRSFVREVSKVTLPVVANEVTWAIGMSMYTVAYGFLGTEQVASKNLMNTLESLTWVTLFGFGNASAVMVGNRIGAGDTQAAYRMAVRFLKTGALLAAGMAVLVVAVAPAALTLFPVSEAVRMAAQRCAVVMALFLIPRMLNFITVVGVLRSGGDTRFCLFLDLASVWLVGVPLAFLGAAVLNLPVWWVFAMASLEEALKLGISLPRVIRGKWTNDVTQSAETEAA